MKTSLLTFVLVVSWVGLGHSQAPARLAGAVVQQQIDAWNRRDAAAFAATYGDTVRLYGFPNISFTEFKTNQRLHDYYKLLFRAKPNLRRTVLNRMVMGNTVVLHERITGRNDGRAAESVVTYKLRGGKIRDVYFDYGKP